MVIMIPVSIQVFCPPWARDIRCTGKRRAADRGAGSAPTRMQDGPAISLAGRNRLLPWRPAAGRVHRPRRRAGNGPRKCPTMAPDRTWAAQSPGTASTPDGGLHIGCTCGGTWLPPPCPQGPVVLDARHDASHGRAMVARIRETRNRASVATLMFSGQALRWPDRPARRSAS